ncbi:hypothetical protein AYI70_g7858 [Smittium culicis]|uniref:Uncharacterized protein n=1 Tax=Smittium culicis TaxID=133412 RepID=A0A1R1XII3_9FUNG|nr:hypothetical protein AYI70_g7858 [Smittium culicis]
MHNTAIVPVLINFIHSNRRLNPASRVHHRTRRRLWKYPQLLLQIRKNPFVRVQLALQTFNKAIVKSHVALLLVRPILNVYS